MGDVVANVTQLEYSNNKYYALTFRSIYIYIYIYNFDMLWIFMTTMAHI